MKKALMIVSILLVAVISTACINNIAVQELNNKASEYMQKGDYEAAMSRLQASIDLDSTVYQTYYNLGVAAINANQYQKAIDALETGISLKPDFYEFYYSMGIAQIGLADDIIDEAKFEEKASADTESGNVEIKHIITDEDKLQSCVLREGAIKNLQKYLQHNPNSKDKELIEEMIKQSEEYISAIEKKDVVNQ